MLLEWTARPQVTAIFHSHLAINSEATRDRRYSWPLMLNSTSPVSSSILVAPS